MRILLLLCVAFIAGCVSPAERARALNPDNRPGATVVIGSSVLVPDEGAKGGTLAEAASAEFADRQRFILKATGNARGMALLCAEDGAIDGAILSDETDIVLPDLVFLTREPTLQETKICQENGKSPVFERIANRKGGPADPAITGIYAAWDDRLARDNAMWFLNHIRDNSPALIARTATADEFEALF